MCKVQNAFWPISCDVITWPTLLQTLARRHTISHTGGAVWWDLRKLRIVLLISESYLKWWWIQKFNWIKFEFVLITNIPIRVIWYASQPLARCILQSAYAFVSLKNDLTLICMPCVSAGRQNRNYVLLDYPNLPVLYYKPVVFPYKTIWLQFNLVCDQSLLVPLPGTIRFVGAFFGTAVAGILSDR